MPRRRRTRFSDPSPPRTFAQAGLGWSFGLGCGAGLFFGVGVATSPRILFGAGAGAGGFCGAGFGAGLVTALGTGYVPRGYGLSSAVFYTPRLDWAEGLLDAALQPRGQRSGSGVDMGGLVMVWWTALRAAWKRAMTKEKIPRGISPPAPEDEARDLEVRGCGGAGWGRSGRAAGNGVSGCGRVAKIVQRVYSAARARRDKNEMGKC